MGEDHFLNLQPGTIVNGRYEVVKCLGTGSMGMVYACRHRELAGHLVAMKVLFVEVARDSVAAQRFRNEIVASYGVSHPNVVRAYEYFRDGDLVAFTMEYIDGGDLADRIGLDEPIPIDEVVQMLYQMCSGIHAVHDAGIVHRDLKPENILLTSQGDIKITDFGIARTGTGPKLTEHGGVVGTIDYVSPEYLEQGQVDSRSDIYALGVLAYEMLTGEAPFKGKSVIETMTMRLRSDPEVPSQYRADCPTELDRIVLRAMARDPEERYQTALEMFTELQVLAASMGSVPLVQSASQTLEQSTAPLEGARIETAPTPRLAVSVEDNFFDEVSVGGGESQVGAKNVSASALLPPSEGSSLAGTTYLTPSLVAKAKQTPTSESQVAYDRYFDDIRPLESVLSTSGVLKEILPSEAGGANDAASSISIGASSLSFDRMKSLSSGLAPQDEGIVKTFLWYLLIILVGFGITFFWIRHYKPELFGFEEPSTQPSYEESI